MAGLMTICVPVNCDSPGAVSRGGASSTHSKQAARDGPLEWKHREALPLPNKGARHKGTQHTHTHKHSDSDLDGHNYGISVCLCHTRTHSSRIHERVTLRIITATKGGGVAMGGGEILPP